MSEDELRTPLVVVAPVNPHPSAAQLNVRTSTTGGGPPTSSSTQQLALSGGRSSTAQSSWMPVAAAGAKDWVTWHALLCPLVCLCWVACSSSAILVNKHILVDLNFPFPCTVAAIGITGTSIISHLALRSMQLQGHSTKAKATVSWSTYFSHIVPAGLCLALSLQLGNAAYLYLSMAYVQMLKAFTPVVTMLFAFLFQLERPSLLLVSAVLLITGGVAVASLGEGAFSATGVSAMVGSMVCEALRLVLTQALVSKRAMHPVQTLAYIAPAAAMWMFVIAGAIEALSIYQSQALFDIAQHPSMLLASAAAGFGANAMAMLVISLSGALTLKCLGLAKDVGLVCVGVLLLGEVVSVLQAVGYGASLLGFFMYNVAKLLQGGRQSYSGSGSNSSDGGSNKLHHCKPGRSTGRVKVEPNQREPAAGRSRERNLLIKAVRPQPAVATGVAVPGHATPAATCGQAATATHWAQTGPCLRQQQAALAAVQPSALEEGEAAAATAAAVQRQSTEDCTRLVAPLAVDTRCVAQQWAGSHTGEVSHMPSSGTQPRLHPLAASPRPLSASLPPTPRTPGC